MPKKPQREFPCPLCTRPTSSYERKTIDVDRRTANVFVIACASCRRRSVLIVCDVGPLERAPTEPDEDLLLRALGRWVN